MTTLIDGWSSILSTGGARLSRYSGPKGFRVVHVRSTLGSEYGKCMARHQATPGQRNASSSQFHCPGWREPKSIDAWRRQIIIVPLPSGALPMASASDDDRDDDFELT